MQRKSFARMDCPVARTLDVIGEAWSMLVLRDVFLGVRRFQDLELRLGIPTSTLTRRLDGLCAHGLLEARTYAERPRRHEYVLTPKGEDLLPVLLAIGAYGNRWFTRAIVPVSTLTGKRVVPVLVDARTGQRLEPRTVALTAGPDAAPELRALLDPPRPLGRHAARIGGDERPRPHLRPPRAKRRRRRNALGTERREVRP